MLGDFEVTSVVRMVCFDFIRRNCSPTRITREVDELLHRSSEGDKGSDVGSMRTDQHWRQAWF